MNRSSIWKNYSSTVFMILAVLSIRSSFAEQVVIPSGSMEPTIQIGDHVFINKVAYEFKLPFTEHSLASISEPHRGDVITFKDPRDPSITLIKRLVGIPGDHLRIQNGLVQINGHTVETTPMNGAKIQEMLNLGGSSFTYVENLDGTRHSVQRLPGHFDLADGQAQLYTVPADHYFFMGDNRDNSADSRVWGFAAKSAIQGRATRVLYSVAWNGIVPSVHFDRTGRTL